MRAAVAVPGGLTALDGVPLGPGPKSRVACICLLFGQCIQPLYQLLSQDGVVCLQLGCHRLRAASMRTLLV